MLHNGLDVFIFVQIQLRRNAAETTKIIKWAFGHYFWKGYLLLSNIKIVFYMCIEIMSLLEGLRLLWVRRDWELLLKQTEIIWFHKVLFGNINKTSYYLFYTQPFHLKIQEFSHISALNTANHTVNVYRIIANVSL